jgi:hypothetical protein
VDTRDLKPTPGLPLHRGINFSCLEVEGDLGGAVFMVGSVVCLLIGLPMARVLFAGGLVGGAILAVAISWWHRRHQWRIAEQAIAGVFGRP